MKIRPKREEDMEDLFHIKKETWLDTYPNEKYGVKYEDIERKFVKRPPKKKSTTKSKTWVVEIDKKIVGFVSIRDKNILGAIYVLPKYQRKGVGEALMEKVLKHCEDSKEVFVKTAVYNQKAINFYKKFGFEIIPNSEETHEGTIKIPTITMKRVKTS